MVLESPLSMCGSDSSTHLLSPLKVPFILGVMACVRSPNFLISWTWALETSLGNVVRPCLKINKENYKIELAAIHNASLYLT